MVYYFVRCVGNVVLSKLVLCRICAVATVDLARVRCIWLFSVQIVVKFCVMYFVLPLTMAVRD